MNTAVENNTGISELNSKAWSLRFSDRAEAVKLAEEAKKSASLNKDILNSNYATLTLSQLGFWISPESDHLLNVSGTISWFEKQKDPIGLSRAYFICANIYDQYGQYDHALRHALNAVKSAEKADKETQADCFTVLGQVYSRTHDHTQAIEELKKGLDLRKELNDQKATASSLNLIARNYTLAKKFKEAEDFYLQSLHLREKIKDNQGIPWTYLGLASLFQEKKDNALSLSYYEKGERSNTVNDERFNLLCLLGKARLFIDQGENPPALINLEQALKKAEILKIQSLIAETHQLLSIVFEKLRQPGPSLLHFKRFNELSQEIMSKEKVTILKHQQIAFSIERSEKEAELHRLKNVELKNAFDTIAKQHHELEEKNKEIVDSINYSKRIQDAYLPNRDLFNKDLLNGFILFQPKDIVSGDFYWFHKLENEGIFFAAADCTGHGVPGAIMSVICCNALNDIVIKKNIHKPNLILDSVREVVIEAFKQKNKEVKQKDGMDIALCFIDSKKK